MDQSSGGFRAGAVMDAPAIIYLTERPMALSEKRQAGERDRVLSIRESTTVLMVNGRELALPTEALRKGNHALMAAKGGYEPLEDFAEAVAVFLAAFEKNAANPFQF